MTKKTGEQNTEQPAAHAGKRRNALVAGFRVMLKALLPLLILAGAYKTYVELKASKPALPKRAQKERVFPVEAIPIEFASLKPVLRLYGETVAGRKVDIRSLVAGEVTEVGPNLREGGEVEKGDKLIVIDPFDFEGAVVEAGAELREAEGRLKELEASYKVELDALVHDREQLDIVNRDLKRAAGLAKKGNVSKKLVDDRQLIVAQRMQAMEQRQNNLVVWRAKIDQQKAAIARSEWRLRQSKRRLAQTELKAPFNAYVSDFNGEVGRYLNANDKVASLLDRDWVEVKFTLSDTQYGRILGETGKIIGRTVDVIWRVGDKPVVYKATVERVGATIQSSSGGVTVFARLENPSEPIPIRSGAFVEILIPDRQYEKVARLPQTAIYGGDTLYVIKKGRLEPRTVRIVGVAEKDVLVRGPVDAGDRVLRTRLSAPGAGLRVEEK